jgi:hypothetical protein
MLVNSNSRVAPTENALRVAAIKRSSAEQDLRFVYHPLAGSSDGFDAAPLAAGWFIGSAFLLGPFMVPWLNHPFNVMGMPHLKDEQGP